MFIGGLLPSFVTSAIPSAETYDSVTFLGEIYLDNIHLINDEYTDAEIGDCIDEQTYGVDTEFLADFDDSLEAGNLTNADVPVTHWKVKRKSSSDLLFTDLVTIAYSADNLNTFVDYSPLIGVEYEYNIYAVSNGTEGQGYGGTGMADTYGWILSSNYVAPAEPAHTYVFDLDIKSGDIKTNKGMKKFENYTQYPAFRFNNMQYDESTLETMPYELDGIEVSVSLDLLNELKEFINDGEIKILRNYKGEAWKIMTFDFSYKYIDEVADAPYKINFAWCQVDTV